MGQKGETKFKIWLMPHLKAIPRSWWVKTQERTTRGVPDVLGCVNGYAVALELKTEAKLEPLQEVTLRKIAESGGYAAVVTPENASLVVSELELLNVLCGRKQLRSRAARQDLGDGCSGRKHQS